MELLKHYARLTPQIEPLAPGDTATVQTVFDGLSERQRRQRFHVPMPRLTRSARRALADVDGIRHVALVLKIGGRPAGIARYVVTGPGEAELAIAIVSEYAGRGYGTGLLEELMAHAGRRGVSRLQFELLADNLPARQLARNHGATLRLDGATYHGVLRTGTATTGQQRHAAAG